MSEARQIVSGPYVLELPDDYERPSDEELSRMRAQLEESMRAEPPRLIIGPPGCTLRPLNVDRPAVQMERLLSLLALTEQERDFVRAALASDAGKDFWLVLADHLEEKGNGAAGRFRALAAADPV